MKKEERIRRYGEVAYEKMLQQSKALYARHPEKAKEQMRAWKKNNPEKTIIHTREACRKGGNGYEHRRQYQMSGIPHEKELIRQKHQDSYRPFKRIIAPESQLHHEWIPSTSEYRGIALVETYQHRHGIIDPILILEGEITLLTEEEVRGGTG